MASQDVIELGSSDDEPEPAPKKMRPLPNAMVHIPNKRHSVATKQSIANVQQKLAGKPVTVKLVEKQVKTKPSNVNPRSYSSNIKIGNTVRSSRILKNPIAIMNSPMPKIITSTSLNAKLPDTSLRKISNSIIKLPNFPVRNVSTPTRNTLQKPAQKVKLKLQNNIYTLPSGVTIKKKPVVNTKDTAKRKFLVSKFGVTKMPIQPQTVELDAEDPLADVPGPQWYIRPEDQTMQSENNREQEPKTIEITIEDSPVKPNSNKRIHEVGAELAITIDDSPVKYNTNNDKDGYSSGSDNECTKTLHMKERQSKRQLDYPKKMDVVEIEIEPIEVDMENEKSDISPEKVNDSKNTKTETERETLHPKHASTPKIVVKEKKSQNKEILNDDIMIVSEEINEFIPVYQSFIDLCFKLENTDDMKKIVEKKIKAYYRQTPKEYIESEEFSDMVTSKILSMQADPEKMFLYIKDIVDELNVQRKMGKTQPLKEVLNDNSVSANEKPWYEEGSDFDFKRQRQIRKLEKTLKKLHRAILKLEEQEVDFDDDEDSVYLLTERYKERMVRVHAKFCQLTNTKMPSEPRIHIEARPGRPSGAAKRLEKWINKKVPIGTPLPFPDFHDVLKCVRDSNTEDKLNWNEADVMDEARDLFVRCGKKLQRRRQENEWRLAASRVTALIDPAEESEELKKKLDDNRRSASKRESEVLNKYADKQNFLKLEGVEINDKEAEESPVESEEDESNDENTSLKSKEKRKKRLKRLLQEKSKRNTNESNENQQHAEAAKTIDTNIPITPEKVEYQTNLPQKDMQKPETTDAQSVNEVSILKNAEEPKNSDKVINNSNSNNIDTSSQENLQAEAKEVQDTVHDIVFDNSDSDKLDSDIDELNLLQKLHSGNEINSSAESSSDTPISICDTSDEEMSEAENCDKQPDDVISIENSSYSESEIKENEEIVEFNDSTVKERIIANDKEFTVTSDEQKHEIVENILLASSDEEVMGNEDNADPSESMNLKDDTISIGETVINQVETKINQDSDLSLNLDKDSSITPEKQVIDINDTKHQLHPENTNSLKEKIPANIVERNDKADSSISKDSESNVCLVKAKSNDTETMETEVIPENKNNDNVVNILSAYANEASGKEDHNNSLNLKHDTISIEDRVLNRVETKTNETTDLLVMPDNNSSGTSNKASLGPTDKQVQDIITEIELLVTDSGQC